MSPDRNPKRPRWGFSDPDEDYMPRSKPVEPPKPTTPKAPTVRTQRALVSPTESFIKDVKDSKHQAALRDVKSLIAHYKKSTRALDALRSLRAQDCREKFLKKFEIIINPKPTK